MCKIVTEDMIPAVIGDVRIMNVFYVSMDGLIEGWMMERNSCIFTALE